MPDRVLVGIAVSKVATTITMRTQRAIGSEPSKAIRSQDKQGGFAMFEPSGEEIARRAHELYVQRGGEHGKDVEDWVTAEKELSNEPVAEPAKTKVRPSRS
jgi:Protein of unknown function (DUF2934)